LLPYEQVQIISRPVDANIVSITPLNNGRLDVIQWFYQCKLGHIYLPMLGCSMQDYWIE